MSGRHVAFATSRLAPLGPSALFDIHQPDQHRKEGAHHNQEAVMGLWSDTTSGSPDAEPDVNTRFEQRRKKHGDDWVQLA